MVTNAGTPERRLHATAHAALDAHAAAVPDALAERLARARALALAELDAGAVAGTPAVQPSRVPRRWVPTFALAATLLFAVGVWDRTAGPAVSPSSPVSPLASTVPPLPALDDPQEARAVQDMELLDDLEFVAWMELQAETELDGGAGGKGAGPAGLDASGVSHAG